METASFAISPTSTSSSAATVTFYDFLDKMRNPAALHLVRSIKSFIVSFSFYAPNPENDGKRVQEFFSTMEAAICDHPLWASATDEEIDCAMEGLEKYVMTKLFSRTFAASPEDVKIDKEISEKTHLLQAFLRPEHLDIPEVLQNEASWLLAEKELQKINAFKAPREKLQCIISCCRIINNLLLNASVSEKRMLGGADDFLPVLIYVTIKANPPRLHSNLRFIQLYRRHAKLVSEAAYYHTNVLSAKSFIVDLNAKSLSIDEIEFEESMQQARSINDASQSESSNVDKPAAFELQDHFGHSIGMNGIQTIISGRSHYPYMDAETGQLTIDDVEKLLGLYKDVVTKYSKLCNAIRHLTISTTETPGPFSRGSTETSLSTTEETDTFLTPVDNAKIFYMLKQPLGEVQVKALCKTIHICIQQAKGVNSGLRYSGQLLFSFLRY